jgi:hypothetical protein
MELQCVMFGGKELMGMDCIESSGILQEDDLTVEKYYVLCHLYCSLAWKHFCFDWYLS